MKRSKTARPQSGHRHQPSYALEGLEPRQLFAATFSDTVPTGFVDTKVADQLSTPTSMDAAPDGRIFISEQDGTIWVVKNGVKLSTPFAHLSPNFEVERGLLGIVLDPNFETNHFLYTYYTSNDAVQHNRIVRLVANGDVSTGTETT